MTFARIPDIDQSRVDYWRALNHDAASTDTDLPVEERRDRADVIPGSFIKRDDDLLLYDAIPYRVIGPGRGAWCVIGYYPEWFGDMTVELEFVAETVTDRAPADTNEAPMPVFPAPILLRTAGGQRANPSAATTAERKRAKRRDLHAFIAKQKPSVQAQLRAALARAGVLDSPKPRPWICRLWLRLVRGIERTPY